MIASAFDQQTFQCYQGVHAVLHRFRSRWSLQLLTAEGAAVRSSTFDAAGNSSQIRRSSSPS